MATPPPRRWQRARRWAIAGAVVAGLYAAGVYALSQLGDERERRRQQDKARENLRMRFVELQDNSNFTVMMLLPNVAAQLAAALDVDGITIALQQMSLPKPSPPVEPPPSIVEASTTSLQDGYDKLTPSEIKQVEPSQEETTQESIASEEAVAPAGPLIVEPEQALPPSESQDLANSALGLSTALPPRAADEHAPPVNDTRTKMELWAELKALAFTRAVASLYLVSFLNLQTTVTLNLLGRADYITSVVDLARDRGLAGELVVADLAAAYASIPGVEQSETSQTDQKFLTFSWYLLHRGWPILVDRVRAAVDQVVGGMSLKTQVSYDELCELLERIRIVVDGDANGQAADFTDVYMPTSLADEIDTLRQGGIPEERAVVDPRLRRLLDETRSLLRSADARSVQKASLNAGFARASASLETAFRGPAPGVGDDGRFSAVGGRTARLANLLPSIARVSNAVLNGFPNEYVEELKDVPELKAFAAIVFSSFS